MKGQAAVAIGIALLLPTFCLATMTETSAMRGRVVGRVLPSNTFPALENSKRARTPTLPTFSERTGAFTFTMIGSDPFRKRARNVTVPVQIIPIRLEFSDGTVLDPTVATDCAAGATPLDLTLASPLFQNVNYGDGPRQFAEHIRRIEFWSVTGGGSRLNPNYSVRVAPIVLHPITIAVTGSYSIRRTPCGRFAFIEQAAWDQYFATTLVPQLLQDGANFTSAFPLLLLTNAALYDGNLSHGAMLGFHAAARDSRGTYYTWGVAEFDTSHADPTTQDVSVLSHEIMEWYDNPYLTNHTPAWGNIGQLKGACDDRLEVGDPLTGTELFEQPMPNGFSYHMQETAFPGWFFHWAPSNGVNGLYSSGGAFKEPADECP